MVAPQTREGWLSEQHKYRQFTPEQKAEIVLAGLRGDRSVRDVCREYQIAETLYYQWRERLLLHLIRLPHAEATTAVRYQIAMASSPNATASRRPSVRRPPARSGRNGCFGPSHARRSRPR